MVVNDGFVKYQYHLLFWCQRFVFLFLDKTANVTSSDSLIFSKNDMLDQQLLSDKG